MTDREALLRAVCDHPDEDTPRLIFADWLDEHGEQDRAEFIRIQIQLSRGEDSANSPLRQREKALLTAHSTEWAEPFKQLPAELVRYLTPDGITYRRGFAWGVEIDDETDQFAEHAPTLFRIAPIRRVEFFHKWRHDAFAACPDIVRLRELRIDRAGFEAADLSALFASPYLGNLGRLDLVGDDDNAHLCAEGVKALGHATGLAALRHIDLSHNWCHWMYSDEPDWLSGLTTGPLMSQLVSIRLQGTFLNDVAAEALAACERLDNLSHLDLSGNMIGERGLRALAGSSHLDRVGTLDLRENRYDTDDGVEVRGCTPDVRRLLIRTFGERVLLDGDAEQGSPQ